MCLVVTIISVLMTSKNQHNFLYVNIIFIKKKLSHVIYTAYFDKLFERLGASGTGCHVGKMYAGAFGYADDVVLL